MTMFMTACSSTDVAESMPNPDMEVVYKRMEIAMELDANYCKLEGFNRYHESTKYYTFECKDGSKLRVPK